MCGSMVDIQSATAEIRQGKKIEEETTLPQGKNIMFSSATQGGHNYYAYMNSKTKTTLGLGNSHNINSI